MARIDALSSLRTPSSGPEARALATSRRDGTRASRASSPRGASAIELSEAARTLDGQRRLLRGLLGGAEERVPAGAELFEQAGRSEYLASIAEPTDLSAEATADRILGGITGYIFGAFSLARGELDADDVEEFAARAREGLERGLREAGEILGAISQLRGDGDGSGDAAPDEGASAPLDTADAIATIRERVLAGLDHFVEDERARLSSRG